MCDTRQPVDPNFPMTFEELKAYLRVSKYTLQDYLAEGLGMQAGFKIGKEWRFMPLDVIEWLKDRHRKNYKVKQNILSHNELQNIARRALKAQK
ncbi:MAG: hypothetical protein A3G93_04815 [Nitrospinae bacterium RIFCSPLOWO2_12_FULL_45_22]|nr:MAG: hypothetical protein A3G93_04815 [Nitrospinae bacterium RIFCSPLOWO2_12_FULL_45_22]